MSSLVAVGWLEPIEPDNPVKRVSTWNVNPVVHLRFAERAEADRVLEAKFSAFKKQNAGQTLHHAAKVVRDFMVWQHNFASIEKPDDRTDEQNDHAERIERAFLLGAAGMAAEAGRGADGAGRGPAAAGDPA